MPIPSSAAAIQDVQNASGHGGYNLEKRWARANPVLTKAASPETAMPIC